MSLAVHLSRCGEFAEIAKFGHTSLDPLWLIRNGLFAAETAHPVAAHSPTAVAEFPPENPVFAVAAEAPIQTVAQTVAQMAVPT